MMLRRMLLLLTALLLLCGHGLAEGELDAAMTELFGKYKAKGGVVLVAKGDEIVYQFAYGQARHEPAVPVTMDTQFRIASVSKMVTAIGVMQQVEAGHIDLDEDISAYFGGTLRNPGYRNTPITTRMIMSHTSSLKPDGDYKKGQETVRDMLDVSQARKKNFFPFKPGTSYSYSNFNGGMLGVLVEAGSGQHVSTYMQQHVFGPLGLEGAYAVAALTDLDRAAETYNTNGTVRDNPVRQAARGFQDVCDPQRHYDMTTGTLWISGPDLCRVGMMLCNRGTLNGVTILRPETVAEMESSQKGKGGVLCTSPYGLNVNRIDNLVEGELIYGHQGISGAVLANLYYEPTRRLTFCMISNGCNNALQARIAGFSRRVFQLCWDAYQAAPLPDMNMADGAFLVTDDDDE